MSLLSLDPLLLLTIFSLIDNPQKCACDCGIECLLADARVHDKQAFFFLPHENGNAPFFFCLPHENGNVLSSPKIEMPHPQLIRRALRNDSLTSRSVWVCRSARRRAPAATFLFSKKPPTATKAFSTKRCAFLHCRRHFPALVLICRCSSPWSRGTAGTARSGCPRRAAARSGALECGAPRA